MIKKRLELSKELVDKYSQDCIKKLNELKEIKEAMVIGLYMPIKNEIEIKIDNKIVCYPKVIGLDMSFFVPDKLEKGYMNILEPTGKLIGKDDIDCIIVPLLYFDKFNNRVGYGKGFYDRYLSNFKGTKIGVAYDFQEVDKIDVKETDVKLDYIIKGVI